MRILFLIRSLEAGGAERQLLLLANGLVEKGHSVGIAVFYPGGVLERELAGPELFSLEKNGRWDVLGFWKSFTACVNSYRPDLLHSYMGTANNLAALFKILHSRQKVVWGIRASRVDFSHYSTLAKLDFFVQKLLSSRVDGIIANSERGRLDAVENGFNGGRFQVIPNGIDTDVFKVDGDARASLRAQWGVKHDEVLIGIVGRLDSMKGHVFFLQAAQELSDKGFPVRFVCVGEGLLAESLQQKTHTLGLDKVVIWAGLQLNMPSVFNALDICCLSSIFGEGFPNVVGEAMSCGTPCIVTDIGDAAEVAGDDCTVVPCRDPLAMADAMQAMLGRLSPILSAKVRARVVDKYSLYRLIDRTEKVLKELCQK